MLYGNVQIVPFCQIFNYFRGGLFGHLGGAGPKMPDGKNLFDNAFAAQGAAGRFSSSTRRADYVAVSASAAISSSFS